MMCHHALHLPNHFDSKMFSSYFFLSIIVFGMVSELRILFFSFQTREKYASGFGMKPDRLAQFNERSTMYVYLSGLCVVVTT